MKMAAEANDTARDLSLVTARRSRRPPMPCPGRQWDHVTEHYVYEAGLPELCPGMCASFINFLRHYYHKHVNDICTNSLEWDFLDNDWISTVNKKPILDI